MLHTTVFKSTFSMRSNNFSSHIFNQLEAFPSLAPVFIIWFCAIYSELIQENMLINLGRFVNWLLDILTMKIMNCSTVGIIQGFTTCSWRATNHQNINFNICVNTSCANFIRNKQINASRAPVLTDEWTFQEIGNLG